MFDIDKETISTYLPKVINHVITSYTQIKNDPNTEFIDNINFDKFNNELRNTYDNRQLFEGINYSRLFKNKFYTRYSLYNTSDIDGFNVEKIYASVLDDFYICDLKCDFNITKIPVNTFSFLNGGNELFHHCFNNISCKDLINISNIKICKAYTGKYFYFIVFFDDMHKFKNNDISRIKKDGLIYENEYADYDEYIKYAYLC